MSAVLPPDVQHVVHNYVAAIPATHWDTIGPFVRTSVSSFAPQSRGVARNYLTATSTFTHWAWQTTGADLDPESIFLPALVGRFVHEMMRERSEVYRYHTAQRLSLMVAHFTGTTPARQSLAEPQAATPYSRRELIEFRSSAVRRNNHDRRRNAHALLGLGAGAGLRTEEIAAALVGDITADDQGLLVRVRGEHPRTVPVRTEWVEALTLATTSRPADDFAFTGYRLPGYAARVVHQFGIDDPAEATPSATRLRATWLVNLLESHTPLDLLLNVSGLSSPTSLAPYLRAMNRHELTDYRGLIIGDGGTR